MTRSQRVFDVVGAGIGLLVLSPLLLMIAAIVWSDAGRPVFYRQERAGYKGKLFRIWKYRTMVMHADRSGPLVTPSGDRRVTRSGQLLRKLKLDELPQLINVLVGEMRLVGPRPDVPRYVSQYTPEQSRVLNFVPGMTDPASLLFRNEAALLEGSADPEAAYIRDILPQKIRLTLDYAGKATQWSDAFVVMLTLLALVPGSARLVTRGLESLGAYDSPSMGERQEPSLARRSSP